MKVIELRIGNYVDFRCIALEIDSPVYKIECGADIQMHQNHSYFKSIILTEQWLKDFGFKKIYDKKFEIIVKGGKRDGDRFVVKRDLDLGWEIFDGNYEENIYIAPSEYVHKLQNIYFELTDKELIKNEIIEKKEVKTKWSIIKCFFGFHEPSSTSEACTWTKKAYSICIHCNKKYMVKYPEF